MSRAPEHIPGVSDSDLTLASLWKPLVGPDHVERVLKWPPDLFALIDRALDASEAYRFVVSPPTDRELEGLGATAATAAIDWWRWLDSEGDRLPDPVLRWWEVVHGAMDVRVDDLAAGGAWPVFGRPYRYGRGDAGARCDRAGRDRSARRLESADGVGAVRPLVPEAGGTRLTL
ncbi:MAG: hypothetical protein R6X23_15040 [Acidimicrobiia bacterium]